MRNSFKLYSDHVVEVLSINFREIGKYLGDQEWRRKMRRIFEEEKYPIARGREDGTMGKVLGWSELVTQQDYYLYFNVQRTAICSRARRYNYIGWYGMIMMMMLTADCS